MSRFVRPSKYRHVFGTPSKSENCFDNIRVSSSAWDSNKVSVSTKFIAVLWESAGGGQFVVLDRKNPVRLTPSYPLISGHKAPVLDICFSPFHPDVVASVSEDGLGMIWSIPEGGLTKSLQSSDASQTLRGHRRKVGTVNWHPTAENILATSSIDFSVKVWDVTKGAVISDASDHSDNIGSVAWNYDGSLLASVSKDKKSRIIDPRTGAVTSVFPSHDGSKGARCLWLGKKGTVLTVGMNKSSTRQFRIWDIRKLDAHLSENSLDTSSGMLMPFYDDDSSVLFLAGKGDTNVRYFEMVDTPPYYYFLSTYSSNTSQVGMAQVPKLCVEVSECEIQVLMKATKNGLDPISFKVPRRSDLFQEDLFPLTRGEESSLTAAEWISGRNADPKLVSLESGYEPPKSKQLEVSKVEETTEKQMTPVEMKSKIADLENRIAFLECEVRKKDALLQQRK